MVYRQFGDFPISLIKYLSKSKYGQIIISSEVEAGLYSRAVRIAKINRGDVIIETGVFQEEVVHLLDHLLGGEPERIDITLSSGYGINEKVKMLGREIKAFFERGNAYYFSAYMGKNEREYLAQAVRQYLQDDPQIIAELDVLLYNMIKNKFLNDMFWRDVL